VFANITTQKGLAEIVAFIRQAGVLSA